MKKRNSYRFFYHTFPLYIRKVVDWLKQHHLWRPHTAPSQRAPREHSLVDQDAESGFHHSLLPGTQPTVARRWSLQRRQGGSGGRGGALGCYPGDDGFFHAGDNDGVPEPSQPPKYRHTNIKVTSVTEVVLYCIYCNVSTMGRGAGTTLLTQHYKVSHLSLAPHYQMTHLHTHSPDDCLCVVGDHRAGQEELRAQQSFIGAKTGQTSIELLPDLSHPHHRPLRDTIRCPNSSPHLEQRRRNYSSVRTAKRPNLM